MEKYKPASRSPSALLGSDILFLAAPTEGLDVPHPNRLITQNGCPAGSHTADRLSWSQEDIYKGQEQQMHEIHESRSADKWPPQRVQELLTLLHLRQ